MTVSRALRRLLRVLELEEEQRRLALESTAGELKRLEQALSATARRNREGRSLVTESARSGHLPDRLAGIEETRAAAQHAAALAPRIAGTQLEASMLREEFLAKRVERRQVGAMIREAEAHEAVEAGRRSQQALDEWYLHRLYRAAGEASSADMPAPQAGQGGKGDASGKS